MAQIRLQNEAATVACARELAASLKPGAVVALSGELGAGKSVFARALMRALGVKDEALPSPTFAIIQTYEGQTCEGQVSGKEPCSVAHMDWYRLDSAEEIEMLGVRDYFEPPWIAIIEWPERAPGLIPAGGVRIQLKCVDEDPELRLVTIDS